MISIPDMLKICVERGTSDLHLSPGVPPIVRIHGEMKPLSLPQLPDYPLPPELTERLIHAILTPEQKKRLDEELTIDFSYKIEDLARFRTNVFFQDRGLAAVFRVIPTKILTFEQLGLPPVVKAMSSLHRGLVLVTGPTGSGKSTTLAAVIDHLNRTRADHILTIEDPIEFVHQCHKSLISQREVGAHATSFASALRAALREDPDVILVGELRDLETIALAIKAAETGHMVFGTLHTNGAAKTVDRIINVFPADEQSQIRTMLSESLIGVVSQVLLQKKDGSGRVAAFDIMVVNNNIRGLIRDGKNYQIPGAIQTGKKYGMVTLENHLNELIQQDIIRAEDAAKYVGADTLVQVEGAEGLSDAERAKRLGMRVDPSPPESDRRSRYRYK